MILPESEADPRHDEGSQPTLVLGTEVFEPQLDPVLELLNRWEEYRHRGQEPPADWTGGIDPALRAELDRRIRRRKRGDLGIEQACLHANNRK